MPEKPLLEVNASTITVRVLLFSALRECIGRAELDVTLAPDSRLTHLLDELEKSFPSIGEYRPVTRIAVNQEYVGGSVDLADGDEVALITPVSGG